MLRSSWNFGRLRQKLLKNLTAGYIGGWIAAEVFSSFKYSRNGPEDYASKDVYYQNISFISISWIFKVSLPQLEVGLDSEAYCRRGRISKVAALVVAEISRCSRKILSGDGGIASMASVAAGSAPGDEICWCEPVVDMRSSETCVLNSSAVILCTLGTHTWSVIHTDVPLSGYCTFGRKSTKVQETTAKKSLSSKVNDVTRIF